MGWFPHAHTNQQAPAVILLPPQKMQLCFTELGQMLLLFSAGVTTCIQETQPEELPTSQREGQAGQANFAQCSHRGSDCSGVCSQSLYPLKERFTEKEGNRIKRSQSEQFLFPLSLSQPALPEQRCCRESPGPSSSDVATYWFCS